MSKIIEYGVNFIDNITISSLVVTSISASSLSISGAVTLPANISTTNLTTSNLIAANSTINNIVATNISSTNLNATNITANGLVSLKSTRGILIGSSTDIDTGRLISALDSGMTANSFRFITFGQAASTNNQAELSFNYVGSGNVLNSMGFGLFGGEKMRIQANGNVGINTNSPSNTLHVNGDLRVAGLITTGNLLATNSTINNIISTNINVTNISTTTINSTGITTSSLLATSLISSSNLTSMNSTLANLISTNMTTATINVTGITTSTLLASSFVSAANVFSTNISTTRLVATDTTTSNFVATTVSASSLVATRITTSTLLATSLISTTNLFADNITANGLVSLKSTRGILIGTSTDIDGNRFISALDSGVLNNSFRSIAFGQSNSTNNQAEMTFFYASSGSTNNVLQLGFFGSTPLILRADGNVGIGTNSPTVKLDVYSDDISSNSLRLLDLKRNLSDGANVGSFMGKNTNARNGLWSWYHHISDGNNDNYVHYDWNGYLNAMTLNARGRVGLSTTAPTNTLHVNGDLRVSSFITTSNLICTNLTTNSLSIPVISDVPAIDPNMTNTLIVHEDFRGTTLRSGTTSGSVSYVQNTGSNNGYLQLTPNSNSQNGYLSWKINPGNAFTITFDHYAGGGLGDMISFSWSSDNISSFGTGYLVEFNELGNIIRLRFNGAVLASSATITNLGNSTWHKSTITFYRNQIRVIYDGVVVINYTDTVFRNVNGAYMYFYSFTGSVSNFHRIRNFRMSKVTEGLWQYQESTSGNIVYDGGNVGIGIDPGYTLHVDGSVRLNSTRGILIGSSTDIDASRLISALDSGMSANSIRFISFGQGAATNNQAELGFQYVGNGNVLNSLNLGFYGGEKMRIQANGFVGIGTNAPTSQLDIKNAGTCVFNLQNTNVGGGRLKVQALSSKTYLQSSGDMLFTDIDDVSGRVVSVTAYGSLGVGTASPSAKLEVYGAATTGDERLVNIWRNNLPNGARVTSFFGKNYDLRNGLYTGYYHTGDGSFDNYVHYDFNGTNNVLVLTAGGGVGVGTNVLNKAKFHVNGSVNSDVGGYGYLNQYGAVNVGGGTWPYSIYATDRIAAAEFNAFSDSRIKENVQDVDDLSALNTLRLIQPKKYNYIDKITRGETPVWGFIAQQVGSVLDYSTGRITDYIPSVYDVAYVTNTENVTTIKLKIKTTSGLVSTSTSTGPVKIKLFTDDKNTVFIATLKDIIDETTFTINESLNQTSKVFVYGIEISDFHTLNKDAIFTINVAATQELDREVQIVNQKYSDLEQKYNDLDQKYSDLEQKYNDLEQKYNDILTILQK
jgi:hypothetical protein